jgi:predicted nucleotidyltransferase
VTIDELTRGLGQALQVQGRPEVRLALLFGSSVTRGLESARDIDIAVAFTRPISLMDQCHLGEHLEGIAGRGPPLKNPQDGSIYGHILSAKGRPEADTLGGGSRDVAAQGA